MSKTNYMILHGCPPNADDIIPHEKRWMNWLATQLQHKGFNAVAPDIPEPWDPKYKDWSDEVEKFDIDENTVLIGHSCSCAFLVRWLLELHRKVKKLVLVAPGIISDRDFALYDFDLPDDASFVADERVIFVSNDKVNILKSVDLYKESLNAHVVHLENKGHFTIFDMGKVEFPELLEEVLK